MKDRRVRGFRFALCVSLFSALALSGGCDREKAGGGQDLAIARLEMQVELLRTQNRALEDRLAALERDGARGASLAPDPTPAAASATTIGARCTPSAGGAFALTRADFEAALADSGGLALEARIVPSFKEGRATGFKLFAIRPDSLFASCGVKNGDVLQAVNGMPVDSPDMALEAYAKAREAKRLEIALTRDGRPAKITIDVGP